MVPGVEFFYCPIFFLCQNPLGHKYWRQNGIMIRRLDPSLAKQVKSGVIITDVVDAFRELVQNSADSGARNIDVVLGLGQGIELKVTDDGCGISPDSLEYVGERYFTSKLSHIDQLNTVKTFGFRGEALSSVAAVSDLRVVSKVEEYNGIFHTLFVNGQHFEVRMIDDDSIFKGEINRKSGTVVHVTHMFENMPVRHRYLSKLSETKILGSLRPVILHLCIVNPFVEITVRLKTVFGNKLVCKLKPAILDTFQQHAGNCFRSIYGLDLQGSSNYLQVSLKRYNVECVVSTLPVQTKSHQHAYYNCRESKDDGLFDEINKLFNNSNFGEGRNQVLVSSIGKSSTSPRKGRSPTKATTSTGNPFRTYPVFVIKIQGPLSQSDITQDPSKNIMRLKHMSIVKPLVMKLMSQFLRSQGYILDNRYSAVPLSKNPEPTLNSFQNCRSVLTVLSKNRIRLGKANDRELKGMITTKDSRSDRGVISRRHVPIQDRILKRQNLDQLSNLGHCDDDIDELQTLELDKQITRDMLDKCKIIAQVDKKFILIKCEKSLFIMDQHACDERIKLEQYLCDFMDKVHGSFINLGLPLNNRGFSIVVPASEMELFSTYREQCEKWGIKYSIDSSNYRVSITHLPELLIKKLDKSGEFLKRCLLQYLYDLQNKVKLKEVHNDWWLAVQSIPTILLELMNSRACRDAIMFGDSLTREECEILIMDLNRCKNPFYCAHGRPSVVPIYYLND